VDQCTRRNRQTCHRKRLGRQDDWTISQVTTVDLRIQAKEEVNSGDLLEEGDTIEYGVPCGSDGDDDLISVTSDVEDIR